MKYEYWYLNGFFNNKEIKDLTKFLEKNYDFIEEDDVRAKHGTGIDKKKTRTLVTRWNKLKEKLDHLQSYVFDINEKVFGYSINQWNNMTPVLLNIYDAKEQGEYGYHYDSSKSTVYDTKLSVLVNLSKSYEGGELWFHQGNEYSIKEFTPGTLLIFKSYIVHKVTPITKGVRKSLTIFCNGPNLV